MKRVVSRRILLVAAGALLAATVFVFAAGDVVSPASLAMTHLRDEGTKTASSTVYWRGDSLLLTNCIVYNGTTTNAAVQGLSNVVVTIEVGNTTSTTYTGTVHSVTGGLYWALITTPTNGSVYMQTTLTDENTNTYTYGWKTLSVKDKLGD